MYYIMCNYPGIYDPQTVTQRGTRVQQNKNCVHARVRGYYIIVIVLLLLFMTIYFIIIVVVVPTCSKRKSHWYMAPGYEAATVQIGAV